MEQKLWKNGKYNLKGGKAGGNEERKRWGNEERKTRGKRRKERG